ncbi:Uncharacterised protein [Vibrio cholerae]|nr:Uncharacterised protein [Vibrio cholerae]
MISNAGNGRICVSNPSHNSPLSVSQRLRWRMEDV